MPTPTARLEETQKMRVIVDGKAVEMPAGATALDALRAAGLDVPTACSDERLEPAGSCRLCLIRIKGDSKLLTACALPLREGLEIEVETPELEAARRSEMALLARHYPAEIVDALPEKRFHHWIKEYGLTPGGVSNGSADDSNPYFRFDPEACIKCFACVRICDQVQGSNVWQILNRGDQTQVVPDSMTTLIESSCKSCGACVDVCPTGALVDKTRLKDGLAEKWTRTTCPYCGVGCELSVGTRGDRIVQVLPVKDSPVSKGHLCVKGRYAHQYVHAPDRVTTPMIRKDGVLMPASWDEALDYTARELKRILKERGPDGVGVLGSARSPNEDNYVAQKFARLVIGTNNVDCCARVCHGPTATAMKAMLGTGAATNSYNDVELAKTILIAGCNPTENHPIVGDRIIQACRNGANLIVVDPRRTELAAMADIHVALKPGTNVPLFNAMAHVILFEGFADQEFLEKRTSESAEFREFIWEWTPERAGQICGVDADTIRAAAKLYARAKPSMCFHGLGMTEHVQGTEGVMSVVNLALLTGNIGKPGSGINPLRGQNNVQGSAHMGCEPNSLTGYVSVSEHRERFEKIWGQPVPATKGQTLMEMLDAAEEGRLKAMWAIGYDIYFSTSSGQRTRRCFEAMEFVIVQDLFLNETAKEFAHVFFPASSSFERDGTFMNAERRVQRVRGAIPPVGDSKPDWEIVQLVAQAMDHAAGFQFTSADQIWEEVRSVWTAGAGMSYQRLEKQGIQWPCTSEDHPGTTILHRDSFPMGPRAPLKRIDYTPTAEITSAEFPYLLNTGRTLYQFNAGTMTGRTHNSLLRPYDTLDIHPKDACELDIGDDDLVRVTSAHGSATLHARLDRGVRRRELFATFHSPEVFMNLVTSRVQDRMTGTPEYKVTAVKLERIKV